MFSGLFWFLVGNHITQREERKPTYKKSTPFRKVSHLFMNKASILWKVSCLFKKQASVLRIPARLQRGTPVYAIRVSGEGVAANLDAELVSEIQQLRAQVKLVVADEGLVAGIVQRQVSPAVCVEVHVAHHGDRLAVWLAELGVVTEDVRLCEGRVVFSSRSAGSLSFDECFPGTTLQHSDISAVLFM
jgi:hypothetical protein